MFLTIVQYVSGISAIITLVILLIKPLREKVLGIKAIKEGQKCQLRAAMLNTYYRHKDDKKIRQYEYENFLLCYKAYKALGGNSFIDKIYKEVTTWEVVT